MKIFVEIVRAMSNREEGQTLTEYGLLLFFIAVVAIAVVIILGQSVSTMFGAIADSVPE